MPATPRRMVSFAPRTFPEAWVPAMVKSEKVVDAALFNYRTASEIYTLSLNAGLPKFL